MNNIVRNTTGNSPGNYAGSEICLLQITDTHVFADPADTFDGADTEASLKQVLSCAGQRHSNTEAILLTGDIVHIPSSEAYGRVRKVLLDFGYPVYCLPGNHDDPEMMKSSLEEDSIRMVDHIITGRWQIVFLDTSVSGKHSGHLPPRQLDILEQRLSSEPDLFSLICLHHHPVPTGSSWMDSMMLNNPQALFDVLDRYHLVRAVVWGHIHQQLDVERNNVKLLGSPSSCVQFKPGSESYAKDTETAGYRWLILKDNGTMDTGIERLGTTV